MGCVSSKLLKKHVKRQEQVVLMLGNNDNRNGDLLQNHVVSLTSSTYGALQLSTIPTPTLRHIIQPPPIKDDNKPAVERIQEVVLVQKPKPPQLEVINTWELMSDLEDDIPPNKEVRTPFKSLTNRLHSPKGLDRSVGKENRDDLQQHHQINQCYTTPKGRVFKPWKRSTNSTDRLRKGTSLDSPRRSTTSSSSSRRRSLGPLFDPDLIHSFEQELSQEQEHIKKMVSPKMANLVRKQPYDFSGKSNDVMLGKYEEKCPPGGRHCVVIYTTTLRGIRKTFEDCNTVRAVIESYHIRLIERDISMDSGFKEELRKLMGTKEVKVPLVFVKGRLIGGANEVVKLDEEGKLQGLLQGIPMAVFGCQGCGGIRFVMCMDCNGSCKVLDQDRKSMIRCCHCNENGLIQCPICSSI